MTACGGDDSSDELFAAVESQSFTFNEIQPEKNAIRVVANAAWKVYWEPSSAVVTVNPSSGSGSGTFYVQSMPKGTSVQIGVQMLDGRTSGNLITVTRTAETGVALALSPSPLTFDPANAGVNVITVTSNAVWTATPSNPALTFTPASGNGNGTISVTGIPAGASYVLSVTAGQGTAAQTRTVTVTRTADPVSDPIFSLDFGNGSTGQWANTTSDWKTQTGTGVATINYQSNNVRINNDNFNSAGKYTGASGKAYAKMFYNAGTDYFEIQHIRLPAGQKNLVLTFGTICPAGDIAVQVSKDGKAWKPLTYTGSSAYNSWAQARVNFTLKTAVPELYLRFLPTGIERSYGLNFDDIVLAAGSGGPEIDLEPVIRNYRWVELPSTPSDMSDKVINTHWATTVTTNQHLRNYTYCYDTRRHCPLWIAHPQHACYQEGSGRTDVWAKDPYMTDEQQAIMYPLEVLPAAMALYSPDKNGGYQWQRGHMLMSNYRGGSGRDINAQTFYSCNIAPQLTAPSAFQTLWGAAEFKIQDYYVCPDTLYCISGAYFADDNQKAFDASCVGADGRYYVPGYSKQCIVPTHFYKLVLRTRSGNSGKAVQECTASELKSVGFWFEHAEQLNGSTSPTLGAGNMMSVEEVEKIVGFTFFPEVPAEVKKQKVPADWGF